MSFDKIKKNEIFPEIQDGAQTPKTQLHDFAKLSVWKRP